MVIGFSRNVTDVTLFLNKKKIIDTCLTRFGAQRNSDFRDVEERPISSVLFALMIRLNVTTSQ